MKKFMKNHKNACTGGRQAGEQQSSAYLFVRKLHEGGLVRFETRPDGQQGVALTSKGQAAMWALDGGSDDSAYDD